jgi:hypothetical protein
VVDGAQVRGLLAFLRGLAKKWCPKRGFWMVNLWWDVWFLWWFGTTFFWLEKYANFIKFIFDDLLG